MEVTTFCYAFASFAEITWGEKSCLKQEVFFQKVLEDGWKMLVQMWSIALESCHNVG